jgi:hypothetical protein
VRSISAIIISGVSAWIGMYSYPGSKYVANHSSSVGTSPLLGVDGDDAPARSTSVVVMAVSSPTGDPQSWAFHHGAEGAPPTGWAVLNRSCSPPDGTTEVRL